MSNLGVLIRVVSKDLPCLCLYYQPPVLGASHPRCQRNKHPSCLTSFSYFSLLADSFSMTLNISKCPNIRGEKMFLNSIIFFNQHSVFFSLSESNFPSSEAKTVDKILCLNPGYLLCYVTLEYYLTSLF